MVIQDLYCVLGHSRMVSPLTSDDGHEFLVVYS